MKALARSAWKALDTAPGTYLAGWSLIVVGVGLQSVPWAMVVGGGLLIGVVIVGALKR